MKKILLLFLISFLLYSKKVYAYTDPAKNSIIFDMDSERVLYCKNCHQKKLIASITKIMTAIITIEKENINKEIEVGDEVLKMYGTNIYIEPKERITIKDLLYGLMLRSGNDAAVVLANVVSNSEEEFVKLMNAKAKKIGMKDTIFENPHGLDEETKNYSTAYDMALLTRYAYKNKIFREISKTKKYKTKSSNKSYIWYNRNKLLNMYKYCTGGKNGYTPSAGKTLITTAEKNNQKITIVTLNDPSSYNNHLNLYETYFNIYKNYKIIDKNSFYIAKELCHEKVYIKEDFIYPLKTSEKEKIKTILKLDKIKRKDKVGKIYIYLNNNKIGSIDIYKQKNKRHKSFINKFKNFFSFNYLIYKNI